MNEQRLILEPCEQNPALAPEILSTWEDELRRLRATYSQHVHDWTPAAIEHDWAGYRAATLEGLDALERRMRLEEAEIYPRILGYRSGRAA